MSLSSEVKKINLPIKLHNKNKIKVDRINNLWQNTCDNIMSTKNVLIEYDYFFESIRKSTLREKDKLTI